MSSLLLPFGDGPIGGRGPHPKEVFHQMRHQLPISSEQPRGKKIVYPSREVCQFGC
jgi:hypothetical protein